MEHKTYVCRFGNYWYVNIDEYHSGSCYKDLILGPYATREIARKVCKSITSSLVFARKKECSKPNPNDLIDTEMFQ